jgi:hypothetical protein
MKSFRYFLQEFPKHEDQADGLWQEICSSLAPENLHEDGEISEMQAAIKLYDIHYDARLLAKTWPCPHHLVDMCDDDISMYARENA